MKGYNTKKTGQLLVEILIAIGLVMVIGGFGSYLTIDSIRSLNISAASMKAISYAEEGIEGVRAIRSKSWKEIVDSKDTNFGVNNSTGEWLFTTDPTIKEEFTRTITIEEVYRDDDGKGAIVESGGEDVYIDAFSFKITSEVTWEQLPGITSRTLASTYVTNWEALGWITTTVDQFNQGTFNETEATAVGDGAVQLTRGLGGFRTEVGTVTTNHEWVTVNLHNTYVNPIIVANYNNSTNSLSAEVRIKNLVANSFEIRLQNPRGLSLNNSQINYWVIEEGNWVLGGIPIEARHHTTDTCGSEWVWWWADRINFSQHFSTAPIVLSQVMTYNKDSWISTWESRQWVWWDPPRKDGFQVGLNCSEVCLWHGEEETIGWIAIEKDGNALIPASAVNQETDIRFETIRTPDYPGGPEGRDQGCFAYNYQEAFQKNPLVITTQNSMDGPNGGWLAECDTSPAAAHVHVEEDQVFDSERWHLTETGGIVAFESDFVISPFGMAIWDFDQTADYNFDPAEIEISSSYAQTIEGETIEAEIYPTEIQTFEDVQKWDSFEETSKKNGGEIYYQLSTDGVSWQYWNGDTWTPATGATDYNTAAEVNSSIREFPESPGTISFKAFLSPAASGDQVLLDRVRIVYRKSSAGGIYNIYGSYESEPATTGKSSTEYTRLEWSEEILTPNEDVRLYVSLAEDAGGGAGTWSSWYGPYTDHHGYWIFDYPSNKPWMKFRAEVWSTTGENTPFLLEVNIYYR